MKKILLENLGQPTMTCGCGKPNCVDDCAKQGNHLNLSHVQSSRRGIDFSCPPNFSFLLGYHKKRCVKPHLPKPHPSDDTNNIGADNVEDEQMDLGKSMNLQVPNQGSTTEMELEHAGDEQHCKDEFEELVGYHKKHCGPRYPKPYGEDDVQKLTADVGIMVDLADHVVVPSIPSSSAAQSTKYAGGVIAITFGDKSAHPLADYITCQEAIYVDQRAGGPIRLTVGETYTFDVGESSEGHQFMLTDHPAGGPEAKKCWHTPVSNGRVTVEVSADFPRRCYYQSTKNPYVGGWVMVNGYTNDKTIRESLAATQIVQ